ncbi:MAG: hypothetical protein H0X24_07710 [Ktedonobacterales bacterium]|nr:hypothetical protein [Ktedonobacterales bacterium]
MDTDQMLWCHAAPQLTLGVSHEGVTATLLAHAMAWHSQIATGTPMWRKAQGTDNAADPR